MADHPTLRVRATGPRARVRALLIDASQVTRALAVADAFRLAIRRSAYELWQAGARGCAVCYSTLRVGSARGGFARVPGHRVEY